MENGECDTIRIAETSLIGLEQERLNKWANCEEFKTRREEEEEERNEKMKQTNFK